MMMTPTLFARAAVRAVPFALAAWLLAPAELAGAFTPAVHKTGGGGESTPLNLNPATTAGHAASTGGPSLVRTIVGLLIVIAVIWGLTWVLKQFKGGGRGGRAGGTGLESVATLPLGSNRSLHLVRAGEDYLLLGSAEQGVTPIHRYSEEQARAAGLLSEEPSRARRLAAAGLGTLGEQSARARAGGEPWPRGPLEVPGQNAGLWERLREWTVRR